MLVKERGNPGYPEKNVSEQGRESAENPAKYHADTVFKNYRPVSNLSFISKVTERALFLQIDNHMKKHYSSNRRRALRSGGGGGATSQ